MSINYYDLGTGRMMIVPKGYEIVTPDSSAQMIFTPWTMDEIKEKIDSGELSVREVEV